MLAEITSKFYSLFVGGFFMLVVYHLLVYIQNKKTFYLYYAGFTFFIMLYIIALNFKDVFGRALLNYNGTFLCMSFAFYFQFIRTLLNTKKQHSTLDNILKIGLTTLVALSIIFPITAIHIGYDFYVKAYNIFGIFFTLYCCTVYVFLATIRTIYSRYLLIGSLTYFICSIIVFFTGIIMGTDSFIEKFGFQLLLISYLGMLLEALIFALLIGYRTKEIELEKITTQANYNFEKQKVVTLLKEQELTSIDAMIQGQEKERQRLASDLHDSVGATLAAARLQFDHLTKQFALKEETATLVNKTSALLTEAYQEIRAMAHLKNSGVIAKKGLLPALEKLAYNASNSGALQINVEDFGLENRLENSLEITLFRIIQELITNIIKHAQATEANITLTHHENEINIIVEDNGKGFVVTPLKKENGMGLGSIEKRVEHLEGSMEIDSTPGKGTTIIIDIPI